MPTLKPVREVFMDPSGFLLHPWMAVLCQADTGVRYSHQTSGVRCLPRSMEGYYLPVFNRETLAHLRSLFEEELEGQGAGQGPEVLTPYRERDQRRCLSGSDGFIRWRSWRSSSATRRFTIWGGGRSLDSGCDSRRTWCAHLGELGLSDDRDQYLRTPGAGQSLTVANGAPWGLWITTPGLLKKAASF